MNRPLIPLFLLLSLTGTFMFSARSHASSSCILDQAKAMFPETEETLDSIVQGDPNRQLEKVLNDRYQKINNLRVQLSTYEGLPDEPRWSIPKKELEEKLKTESNDLTQMLKRLYDRGGIQNEITQNNGYDVLSIHLKNLPSGDERLLQVLKQVGNRMDPAKIIGRKDFDLTVQFYPAAGYGSSAASWSEGGWAILMPPTHSNIMTFLPKETVLRNELFHEIGHGFFSKRRLLKRMTTPYDFQFYPSSQIGGIYGRRMSGEEYYEYINAPYWSWRELPPEKVTPQNLIELHNDIVNTQSSGLSALDRHLSRWFNKGEQTVSLKNIQYKSNSGSLLITNEGKNNIEIYMNPAFREKMNLPSGSALSKVTSLFKSKSSANFTPVEKQLMQLKRMNDLSIIESEELKKELIQAQKDLSAGRITPQEAHRMVLRRLRKYVKPSREALYGV